MGNLRRDTLQGLVRLRIPRAAARGPEMAPGIDLGERPRWG